MSTKCSLAHNNGKDGRTDFHLYYEALSHTLHLQIKGTDSEILTGKNFNITTINIPADILEDIINGLLTYKDMLQQDASI